MLKSKKNRDSALLIFMGLVTIFFLVYLFFPSLRENEEGKKETRGNTNITAIQNSVPGSGSKDRIINDSSDFLSGLRQKLKETQELISSSQSPFYPPKSDDIEQLFLKTYKWDKEGELEKLLKYTFRDLDRVFDNKFVKNLEPGEKFNIFIALFLIRADREMIAAKAGSLSLKDIYGLSGLSSYEMIENEIQYNYQSIPVIFFSSLFISRDSLIPPSEETLKFFKKTEKIRDISDGQLLNSLKSIVLHSADQKTFSIEWKEYDPLDPDDVGKYRGIGCLVEK